MFLVTHQLPMSMAIVTACLRICNGEVKTSDACHGLPHVSQTHNILQCDEGAHICITEVRYYQWDAKDLECPRLLASSVPNRCCSRNPERCNWIRNVDDDRQKLQRNCTGQNQCDLHSLSPEIIADPCLQFTGISGFSSVRSIIYSCTSSGICPPLSRTATSPFTGSSGETVSIGDLETTLPTDRSNQKDVTSEEISSTSHTNSLVVENTTLDRPHLQEKNATGAVVGGVIAGLMTCALIVALLVFLWKKRSAEKPQASRGCDDVTEIQTVCRPSAAYDNINSRYSLYQLERDDNKTPWNRGAETNVSDLYSKVNKTKPVDSSGDAVFSVGAAVSTTNHHGNYDRVQGEAAHFTVHGDYDHVIRHSNGESSSDGIPADVDMTYNHLHRGRAVPARTETEVDPYDVLNRANTRTT